MPTLDDFYLLSRTALVKDEKNYDKFDRAFSAYFKGLDDLHGLLESLIPDEWLRHEFEKSLSPEDLKEIEGLGGLEKLIEAFKKAKEEAESKAGEEGKDGDEGNADQEGQGGPGGMGRGKKEKGQEGMGRASVQKPRRFRRARDPKHQNGAAAAEKICRTGVEDELDIDHTIRSTAHNGGMLDIKMRPERRNTVKVLLFLDIGGSMDSHVKVYEELFSASRTEFKHLESFYFHNFIYESVWKDNRRRMSERLSTLDILNKYSHDYKVVFVGDVTMAPYEITHGGQR